MQISEIPIEFILNNLTDGQKDYLTTRFKIDKMNKEKLPVSEIASKVYLSASRVYKIIEKLK
jgi:Mn-dependent DtxR family transcriptional regulator